MTILVVAIAPDASIDSEHQRKLRKTGRWLINNLGEQMTEIEDEQFVVKVKVTKKSRKDGDA